MSGESKKNKVQNYFKSAIETKKIYMKKYQISIIKVSTVSKMSSGSSKDFTLKP